MLAYAAHRRRVAERHPAPHVMMLIVTGHIALIAAVMSAKMDLPIKIFDPPIIVKPIRIPLPPPPNPTPHHMQTGTKPVIGPAKPIVPLTHPTDKGLEPTRDPPIPGGDAIGFPSHGNTPLPLSAVRVGPRFATPPAEVRPPYPPSKLDREEEAVLRLKLTIDANGRVIAVDPVGQADPAFLAAARKHLLAHWRYKPATEDGRAMASATVITLRFELNE